MKIWGNLLTENDKKIIRNAKMGKRMGFGKKIGVLIIDGQNYMLGDSPKKIEESIKKYPSSCGLMGWNALKQIKRIISKAREKNLKIFYTKMELAANKKDAGVYALKRDILQTQNWFLEGTYGSEISSEISPKDEDFVILKKKPSAFFGTPLISYLNYYKIDTLIITGGATSNCVRATVFDSSSYNFRTIVAEDAVFDRIELSHKVSLFDMDRQFADVIKTDEILIELDKLN